MTRISLLLVVAGLLAAFETRLPAQTALDQQAAQRMARYNVVWTSPSKDATGVMPIGNGDIAAGVYAIENGDLYLLLAKNDALSFCGDIYKTGRLRIALDPNPFEKGKPFRQTLDLPTASIRIEADGVKLRIWADANRPIYHVEIDSPHELTVSAQPEFWKRYNQWKGLDNNARRATAARPRSALVLRVGDKSFYRDDMMGRGYQVENFDKIVPDPYRHNTFGNLVELKVDDSSRSPEVKDGRLTGSGKQFDVRIHALTRQTPDPDVWVKAIEQLAAQPVDLKKDWDEALPLVGGLLGPRVDHRVRPDRAGGSSASGFNGEVGPSGMRGGRRRGEWWRRATTCSASTWPPRDAAGCRSNSTAGCLPSSIG